MNSSKDSIVKQQPLEILGGKPIDFHVLDDLMFNISPAKIKTALRYSNVDLIEEMRRYAVKKEGLKFNWTIVLWIILIAIILIGGILALMYGPQLMNGIQHMMPK